MVWKFACDLKRIPNPLIVLGRDTIRLFTISKVITIPTMSLYFKVLLFKIHVSQICF